MVITVTHSMRRWLRFVCEPGLGAEGMYCIMSQQQQKYIISTSCQHQELSAPGRWGLQMNVVNECCARRSTYSIRPWSQMLQKTPIQSPLRTTASGEK